MQRFNPLMNTKNMTISTRIFTCDIHRPQLHLDHRQLIFHTTKIAVLVVDKLRGRDNIVFAPACLAAFIDYVERNLVPCRNINFNRKLNA